MIFRLVRDYHLISHNELIRISLLYGKREYAILLTTEQKKILDPVLDALENEVELANRECKRERGENELNNKVITHDIK